MDNRIGQRLRLQPYQRRAGARVARGRDHWEAVAGKRGGTRQDFLETVLRQRGARQLMQMVNRTSRGKPVCARVAHNRWIGDCECGGAEVVDPDAGDSFYCLSCYNEVNSHLPRPLEFPADWEDVEDVLSARPDPTTRNYTPEEAVLANPNLGHLQAETVSMLEAENVLHGIPRKRSQTPAPERNPPRGEPRPPRGAGGGGD